MGEMELRVPFGLQESPAVFTPVVASVTSAPTLVSAKRQVLPKPMPDIEVLISHQLECPVRPDLSNLS
jgi:hypothetical protein